MNLVFLHQRGRPVAALALALIATAALGETDLTPEQYVTIKLNAQALTVEGIQQRYDRLQAAPHDSENQYRVGQIVQSEVGRVFENHGITKRAFLKYGAEHEAEIAAWLGDNPAVARELEELSERRSSLSNQIQTLKEK